jgi:hypothetical protein
LRVRLAEASHSIQAPDAALSMFAAVAAERHRKAPGVDYYFNSGHSLSAADRNASSPGTVEYFVVVPRPL